MKTTVLLPLTIAFLRSKRIRAVRLRPAEVSFTSGHNLLHSCERRSRTLPSPGAECGRRRSCTRRPWRPVAAGEWRQAPPADSPRLLPRGRHAQALFIRFRHQDGESGCPENLERQDRDGRQRRMGRRDQLCRDGAGGEGRLRGRVHRYRSRRRQRHVRARAPGEDRRLRLSRRA